MKKNNKKITDGSAPYSGAMSKEAALEYTASKKRTKRRIAGSASMLILAVTLLFTAVLAWFVNNDSATGKGMNFRVDNSSSNVYVDSGVTLNEDVVILAATKPSEVSASDLGKVLFIKKYTVCSKGVHDISATVTDISAKYGNNGTTVQDHGLHYMFLASPQPETNKTFFAEYLKNTDNAASLDSGFILPSGSMTQSGDIYTGTITVIFYADYTKVGSRISSGNEINYSAKIKFSAAS